MKKMVNYIVKICNKISRLIYWITPAENRVESHIALKRKLFDNLCAETFDNFSEHFKKSILYEGREDIWKIRNYAIKKALLNDKDEEFFYMEFGVWNGTSANYFSRYLKKLYAFDISNVLFKPTFASQNQFRNSFEDTLSYFVGGNIEEDNGFAIKPWFKIRFAENKIVISHDNAIAMGNYYFTSVEDKKNETKVEYTFGYIKDKKGNLRINLHHSSIPHSNN